MQLNFLLYSPIDPTFREIKIIIITLISPINIFVFTILIFFFSVTIKYIKEKFSTFDSAEWRIKEMWSLPYVNLLIEIFNF